MTLKEFYEQIDSDYKDVIKRLCDEDRLYEASYELTEKLRNRVIDNCDELYNAVERLYTYLIAKIKEID